MDGFWRSLREYVGPPHYVSGLAALGAVVLSLYLWGAGGATIDECLGVLGMLLWVDALVFRLYRWNIGRCSARAIRESGRNGSALHLARSLQRTSLLRAGAKLIILVAVVLLTLRLEVVRVGGFAGFEGIIGGNFIAVPSNLDHISILGVDWLDEFVVRTSGHALRAGIIATAALFLLADVVEDVDYRHLFGIVGGEPRDAIHGPSLAILRLEDQLREAREEITRLQALVHEGRA